MPHLTPDLLPVYDRDVSVEALLDMGQGFPDNVVIIRVKDTEPAKHICYEFKGINGLTCFSNKMYASMFMAMIMEDAMNDVEYDMLALDEALDIAKAKPEHIVALLLFDTIAEPSVMYVK